MARQAGIRKQMVASYGVDLEGLPATEAFGRRLGELLFPGAVVGLIGPLGAGQTHLGPAGRSEEHTSELQPTCKLGCRLLPGKKKDIGRHLSPAAGTELPSPS